MTTNQNNDPIERTGWLLWKLFHNLGFNADETKKAVQDLKNLAYADALDDLFSRLDEETKKTIESKIRDTNNKENGLIFANAFSARYANDEIGNALRSSAEKITTKYMTAMMEKATDAQKVAIEPVLKKISEIANNKKI